MTNATGPTGTVSVIQTSSNAVVATVTVGNTPNGVAITPNGNYAYVANNSGSDVSVIQISSNTVVATVTVGIGPLGVAISAITPPTPPTPTLVSVLNLQGQQMKNDFGVVYELENQLSWNPNPAASFVAGYNVLRDGVLIATLSPSTFQYTDHNVPKSTSITYAIITFDIYGNYSASATVTVQ